MADDLFGAAAEDRLASRAPLAERLRPRSLDHVVGQGHLLDPGRPLRVLIEGDRLSSVILWGPPGTGKTTLARVIAGHTAKAFETLSAVTAGVKDVREVVARAEHRLLVAVAAGTPINDIAAALEAADPAIDVTCLFACLSAAGALLPV